MFYDILGAICLAGLCAALAYVFIISAKYTAKIEQYKVKILSFLVSQLDEYDNKENDN